MEQGALSTVSFEVTAATGQEVFPELTNPAPCIFTIVLLLTFQFSESSAGDL